MVSSIGSSTATMVRPRISQRLWGTLNGMRVPHEHQATGAKGAWRFSAPITTQTLPPAKFYPGANHYQAGCLYLFPKSVRDLEWSGKPFEEEVGGL
jgi:hypothetical protein